MAGLDLQRGGAVDDPGISLWDRVYAALEGHRLRGDATAQAALDRIAAKVLGLTERLSFNPSTCSVREEALSMEILRSLHVYHEQARPQANHDTIVVIDWNGRRVVVDGNNRVNRWRREGNVGRRSAIVIAPLQEERADATSS